MRKQSTVSLFQYALTIAAVGVAFFLWKGCMAVLSTSLAFLDRQTTLVVGTILLVIGLQVFRRMPKHRKIGLAVGALGALLVAYGLGYLG